MNYLGTDFPNKTKWMNSLLKQVKQTFLSQLFSLFNVLCLFTIILYFTKINENWIKNEDWIWMSIRPTPVISRNGGQDVEKKNKSKKLKKNKK